MLVFFLIHGAAARVPPEATAFGARKQHCDVNAISQWRDPSDSERQTTRVREIWSTIEPYAAGAAMVNHLNTEDRVERIRASYGGNYDKLSAIKRKYDPTNFFRLNALVSKLAAFFRPAD